MKRERACVSKVLFRFVKQVASLAKKYSAVGLLKISNPAGNGFAGWKPVVLHYLRIEQESSYANVVDFASEMDHGRALLQLPLHGFPDASTLYRSFNRAPMVVWRAGWVGHQHSSNGPVTRPSIPRFSNAGKPLLITCVELTGRSIRSRLRS